MAKRVCAEDGCPVLGAHRFCPAHRRAKEQARGSRQQRGYDGRYDAEHRAWQRKLDTEGPVPCWRCEELGEPHLVDPRPGRWHLGHDLNDRGIIRGPQCPSSNLTDAAVLRR